MAPRFFACSNSSITRIPAPSPITKPLRLMSNGIEAFIGSVDNDNAVMLVNPATPSSVIAASAPPATITSASPYWIERNASPILWFPVAHAVTILIFLPFNPSWIATFPAAMFEISIGIIKGDTRFGPLSSSFLYSRSIHWRLPIPQPTLTPTINGSSFSRSSSLSSSACLDAATANCAKRSIRRADLGSICSFGSKSFTSAASFAL